MKQVDKPVASDAEWYFRRDPEADRYYDIFFAMCHKYNVRWTAASETEKQFIEEITRVTYERDKATRLGQPLSEIKPAFAS